MPVFMIERRYADELDVTADSASGINRINDDEGVRWLYSFLSADKRKTYCLYEAPSAEAIRRAAERAGLPADVIVEVTSPHRGRRVADRGLTTPDVRHGATAAAGPGTPRSARPGCGSRNRSSPGCSARGWRRCSR